MNKKQNINNIINGGYNEIYEAVVDLKKRIEEHEQRFSSLYCKDKNIDIPKFSVMYRNEDGSYYPFIDEFKPEKK